MDKPIVKELSKSVNFEGQQQEKNAGKEEYNADGSKETMSNSGKQAFFRWDGVKKKEPEDTSGADEIKEMLRNPGPPPGFCTQMVYSQEVSMVEDAGSRANKGPSSQGSVESNTQPANIIQNNSDFHQLQEKKKKELSRPTHFNILIAGASGLGKSSFIDAFLHRKFIQQPVIKDPTSKIEQHFATRKQGLVQLVLCMIDTPGYRINTYQKYCQDLESEITKRFLSNYEDSQKMKKRDQVLKNSFQPKDTRIHCCLYFMNGPRISQEDGYIIERLSKLVNIIPILARGDTFTKQQIKEIKININKQKEQMRLQWFECQEVLRSRQPQKVNQLIDGPFGKAPPFVMVSSIKRIKIKNQRTIFGRQYQWGICDMENRKHSDFMLLYNLLIVHFSDTLIKCTEIQQEEFIKQSRGKPKNDKMIGIGLVCVIIGISLATLFQK